MLDKVIIGLLLIVLPVGVYMSRKFDQKSQTGVVDEQALAKVDELIAQINQAAQVKQEPSVPKFTVTSVQLATESAMVKVAGVAPKTNAQVMVSAVVVQTDSEMVADPTADATESAGTPQASSVLGQSVEVLAIPVRAGGDFMFEIPVDEDRLDSLERLEIRLEQGASSTTILYDAGTKQFEQI